MTGPLPSAQTGAARLPKGQAGNGPSLWDYRIAVETDSPRLLKRQAQTPEAATNTWQSLLDDPTPAPRCRTWAVQHLPVPRGSGSEVMTLAQWLSVQSLQPFGVVPPGHPSPQRPGAAALWAAALETGRIAPDELVRREPDLSVLGHAVLRGDRDTVRALLARGALERSPDGGGLLSLIRPERGGDHAALVPDLLDAGLSPRPSEAHPERRHLLPRLLSFAEVRPSAEGTPIPNEFWSVVDRLLDAGASVDGWFNGFPLMALAARSVPDSLIDRLLRAGAPVRSPECLAAAARHVRPTAVRLFLKYGASWPSTAADRPVLVQVLEAHTNHLKYHPDIPPPPALGDLIAALIEHGARGGERDRYGTSALLLACHTGDADLVAQLVPTAAEDSGNQHVRVLFHRGDTPAARNLLPLLLLNGVDIDATDRSEHTLLGTALANRQFPLAFFLMQHGADPQHRCGSSGTAWGMSPDPQERDAALARLAEQALAETVASPDPVVPARIARLRL